MNIDDTTHAGLGIPVYIINVIKSIRRITRHIAHMPMSLGQKCQRGVRLITVHLEIYTGATDVLSFQPTLFCSCRIDIKACHVLHLDQLMCYDNGLYNLFACTYQS